MMPSPANCVKHLGGADLGRKIVGEWGGMSWLGINRKVSLVWVAQLWPLLHMAPPS
jgi:hypothetical protein